MKTLLKLAAQHFLPCKRFIGLFESVLITNKSANKEYTDFYDFGVILTFELLLKYGILWYFCAYFVILKIAVKFGIITRAHGSSTICQCRVVL